jgi:D-alanyl-lipoteichoic acid acyltransferase DltB (MBOAT superfamily)
MAWGLFKKVIIADRLAIIVDTVYNNPHEHTGLTLIIASIFFSFQIFCDFSGYSDMAIGAAQVMGFKLMKNFDRPYHSKSISEFWRRWHISLSTWFRDYLYISLGGNRVSIPRWYLNLFVIFMVSGLWHGANWTFIIWGALHGFYSVFGLATKKLRNKISILIGLNNFPAINNTLQLLTTFSLVTFAWIFFRAKTVSDAFYIIKHSITGFTMDLPKFINGTLFIPNQGLSSYEVIAALIAILIMESIHLMQVKYDIRDWIRNQPSLFRWCMYYTCIITIILLHVSGKNQFIYFQF